MPENGIPRADPTVVRKEEHLKPEKGIPKAPRYVMPTEEPYALYVADVARITGRHKLTIRKWADNGLINHIRLPNGFRMFRQSDAYRLAGFTPPPRPGERSGDQD